MNDAAPLEDPPPDPRRNRFVPLSIAMLRLLAAIAVLALLTVLAPQPWDVAAGWAMVGVLVAAPLFRVLWLVQRWLRRGDPRYAVVGMAVLAVVLAGAALAAI